MQKLMYPVFLAFARILRACSKSMWLPDGSVILCCYFFSAKYGSVLLFSRYSCKSGYVCKAKYPVGILDSLVCVTPSIPWVLWWVRKCSGSTSSTENKVTSPWQLWTDHRACCTWKARHPRCWRKPKVSSTWPWLYFPYLQAQKEAFELKLRCLVNLAYTLGKFWSE